MWDRRPARWPSGRVRYILIYALHDRCLGSVFDPDLWRARKSFAKIIAILNLRARQGRRDDGGYGYRCEERAQRMTTLTVSATSATRLIIEPHGVCAT